jgi:serine/threonine-protein kinase
MADEPRDPYALLVAARDPTPTRLLAQGSVFAGKYRIDGVLREGGMGTVALATHIRLEERVAIKVLLPSLAGDEELVARFLREGRAQVKIRSEHVARVFDVEPLEDGTPYMVMEYLEGRDLERILADEGPLPVAAAIGYVLQACEALAEAHALGIVHRDLKPSNLFLTRRADGSDCIKLLDFGVAKVTRAGEPAMTKAQALLGSPMYMAPEQLRSSRSVDSRADIWALGAVLHELVTGTSPFTGASVEELAIVVTTEPPVSLRAVRPELPRELEALVLRCLEKDPARRFATVSEFARAASLVEGSDDARASAGRIARVLAAGEPANRGDRSGEARRGSVRWRVSSTHLVGVAVAAVLVGSVTLGSKPSADAASAPAVRPPSAVPTSPVSVEVACEAPPVPAASGPEPPAPRPANRRTVKAPASKSAPSREGTAAHVEDIH